MKKIPIVAWREFKHTALTKAFIIGSIIVPVLIIPLLIVLPALFSQDVEPLKGTVVLIGPDVLEAAEELAAADRTNSGQEALEQTLEQLPEGAVDPVSKHMASSMMGSDTELDLAFERGEYDALEDMKELVRSHELTAVVVLQDGILQPSPGNEANRFEVFVRPGLSARHLEIIDDLISDAVVETRVVATGMKFEELRTMMRAPRSDTMRLQEGGGEAIEYEWAKRLIPMAFMFLVWIATFSSGNYLLTSTIEEKSNKVMEVLLSAVSPFQLMAGKILGQAFVSLVTLVMYGGLGLAALFALSQADLVPISMIILLLLYFGMAYFMIASIMASVGSAVSDLHDAQSLIGPAMMILILPLILWMPISEAPNGMLAMVTSWVPPLIPFIMILRVTASGDPVPIWQILGTLIVGYGAVIVMVWFCSRIFRVGVLMQGKPPSPLQMIKWIRYK
ncbi:MAG: ABC transporter permease [Planctomycetota bacterium]|nr:ABC transporter permease [Planctomycetota bacterium]